MSLQDFTVGVAVGTTNAGKLAAVRQVFQEWFDAARAPQCVAVEIEAHATESGVSDQPMGIDETIRGARNRVANLAAGGRTDIPAGTAQQRRYLVALESGVIAVGGGALFDVCACAVMRVCPDGRAVRVGLSSGFALPPAVADAFTSTSSPTHHEYNASVEEALSYPPDPTGGGLLGAMVREALPRGITGGEMDALSTLTRPGQMRTAVAMALLQVECGTAYPDSRQSFRDSPLPAVPAASPLPYAPAARGHVDAVSDEVLVLDEEGADATTVTLPAPPPLRGPGRDRQSSSCDDGLEVLSYASDPAAAAQEAVVLDSDGSCEVQEVQYPSFDTMGDTMRDSLAAGSPSSSYSAESPNSEKKRKKRLGLFGKATEDDGKITTETDPKKRSKLSPVTIGAAIKRWERGGGKSSPTRDSEAPIVVTEADQNVRLRIVPVTEHVKYPWSLATRAQITAQLSKFRATIRSVAGGYAVVELADGIIQGKGMYYSVLDSAPPFPPAYKVLSTPQNADAADMLVPVDGSPAPGARSVMTEVRVKDDDEVLALSSTTRSNPADIFDVGVYVMCDGLKKSTEINGRRGKVLGRQQQGREMLIQCDFDGILKAVKKSNLKPVCAAETCSAAPKVRCTNCDNYYCGSCKCGCLDDQDKRADAWVKDEASNICTGCGSSFTLTRRRHHCRACGHLFCSDCVKARQMIPGFSTPQKVCGSCAKSAVASAKAWVRDEDADECELCWAEFTSKKRRHHCRACGKVFCQGCSGQKIRVSGYMMPQRVCNRCVCASKKQDDSIDFAPRLLPAEYDQQEVRVTLHGAIHIPKNDLLGTSSQVFVRLRARAGKGKYVGREVTWPVVTGGHEPTWFTTRCLGCKIGDAATLEFRLWSKDAMGEDHFVGDASATLGVFRPGKAGQVSIRCADRKNAALLMSIPTPPPAVKNVFFIRHGQSRWNAAKAAGGKQRFVDSVKETDHPLSALGCEQASTLCARIEEVLYDKVETDLKKKLQNVDIVYASPLARASQTALIGVNPIIRNTQTEKLHLTRYAREKRNVGGRDTTSSVQGEQVAKRIQKETDRLFGGNVPNTIDFGCIEWSQVNVKWWNDSAETKEEFTDRLKELTNTIQHSPHDNIMIVGHSHCFRGLVNHLISPKARLPEGVTFSDLRQQKLNNCGMMQCTLDFEQVHPLVTVDLLFDTHLVGKKKKAKDGQDNEPDPEDDEEDDEV